ncbi:hypothetical protein GGR52DRAFT_524275 [Hypoxylon sp. FL1284]|nr:hypothetical protein GGR52DRAFT_524275 [Hypoxylon sp. FL1284]
MQCTSSRLFKQEPIAAMPVLTKRRRAEMRSTPEGRAQLEAEESLELPTPKRRRNTSSKKSIIKLEQASEKAQTSDQRATSTAGPSSAGSGGAGHRDADEQAEVDAQLQAELEAHLRHLSAARSIDRGFHSADKEARLGIPTTINTRPPQAGQSPGRHSAETSASQEAPLKKRSAESRPNPQTGDKGDIYKPSAFSGSRNSEEGGDDVGKALLEPAE